jgi:hypothetical protein
MSCVVAIEGFPLSQQYVVKEMTILFETNQYQHFHFNCPIDLIIAPRDWNTIRYNQNHNGLTLSNDSFLPYGVIGYILSQIENLLIYTAGNQAREFLSSYLPKTNIVDICQEYNFKYPLVLQETPCFISHPSRFCSLSKAKTLKMAVQIFQVGLQC